MDSQVVVYLTNKLRIRLCDVRNNEVYFFYLSFRSVLDNFNFSVWRRMADVFCDSKGSDFQNVVMVNDHFTVCFIMQTSSSSRFSRPFFFHPKNLIIFLEHFWFWLANVYAVLNSVKVRHLPKMISDITWINRNDQED